MRRIASEKQKQKQYNKTRADGLSVSDAKGRGGGIS
jgi:hypothetical protein